MELTCKDPLQVGSFLFYIARWSSWELAGLTPRRPQVQALPSHPYLPWPGVIKADHRGCDPRTQSVVEKGKTMNREFLQNIKVNGEALPKEVIDAIMAENGRDIETAKKPFADYDTIKEQLEAAQKTLKGFEGQDIETARKAAKDWEEKYNQAVEEHKQQMADLEFDGILKDAITTAKGRNAKAIRALLDVDALKGSKNRDGDIKAALETLKKDSGYLFEGEQTPPPYAGGAGGGVPTATGMEAIRSAAGLK